MPTAEKGGQNGLPEHYVRLTHSEHPAEHQQLGIADATETITATLILRRRPNGDMKDLDYFQHTALTDRHHVAHKDFAAIHGAADDDLAKVEKFAQTHDLEVTEANAARRSVVVRGTAAQLNAAFAIELQHYGSPLGEYHGHEGQPALPADISDIVELIVGLDNRPVPAKHYSTTLPPAAPAETTPDGAAPFVSADPPNTVSLTPQQVAKLYSFPEGNGAGQTIGIYEMPTSDGNPGYDLADVTATIKAFGGDLQVIQPVDVSIDGQKNTGTTDPETLLDITVSSAIAQGATIAVYFAAGASTQNIIHALQRMIHPDAGDPVPTILSISYGWSPDNLTDSITAAEYQQMSQLFQDAAHLGITVLVSSGDSGALIASKTQAEASYPATDPWVTACGGTTIGDVNGDYSSFIEYVWNDSWGEGQNKQEGATGGGVSERFPIPSYQNGFPIPESLAEKMKGRGIPDLAGPASPVSGYPQVTGGQEGSGGGTSAVAPLYAGLIALINTNLSTPVGFINPHLYALADTAFREISGPPGPADNSFGKVTGYPAGKVWNACTGLGSINGSALQNGLKTTATESPEEIKVSPIAAKPKTPSPTSMATPASNPTTTGSTATRPSRLTLGGAATTRPSRLTTATPEIAAATSKKEFNPTISNHPNLPAIDWTSIGQSAPQLPATPVGELPAADAVVICWAESEWAATQHVFCSSSQSMPYNSRSTGEWPGWQKYDKNLPEGADPTWTFWGYYRLVILGSRRVLLFKSNTHLDFPGAAYLAQLIGIFISDVHPSLILSTGTAGGTIPTDPIGTISVVHAGTLYEAGQPPAQWQTWSNSWMAGWQVVANANFHQLLFPIPTTAADISAVSEQFNRFYGTAYPTTDLNVNGLDMGAPIPALNNMTAAGTSLLTATSFVVGTSDGNMAGYACIEMDDAVIAKACEGTSAAFGFVRNISDPVQNATLPAQAQSDWGSAIYNAYGFYTSYNGALTAWAILSA